MKAHFPDLSLRPIAIVDDCEDDAFLLRYRLREAEITNPIRTFPSGAETLDFLRTCDALEPLPTLMFVEIKTPDGSGFDLIAEVRACPTWDDARVVVHTNSSEPADLERAIELGANGYLIKTPPAYILGQFVHNGPWFAVPGRSSPALVNPLSA